MRQHSFVFECPIDIKQYRSSLEFQEATISTHLNIPSTYGFDTSVINDRSCQSKNGNYIEFWQFY